MKAIKIVNQEQLEQKAIDSMIAYEHGSISIREMHLAITRALRHYGNIEGHRRIVLKGWIIKTIHALNSLQLAHLDQITLKDLNN